MSATLTDPPPIQGHVAPGFEPVREAFAQAFTRHGETGAACTVMHQGRTVVQLRGGTTDVAQTQPWQPDTMLLVYSLTKGMTGLAAALAVSRGLFRYEQRVAEVWPEFAANGKQDITIRQLLSEQAGMAAMDLKLNLGNMGDQNTLAAALARQAPNWTPGDWAGNHAYTIGWLASELIRRTDPRRRTLGRFFADEIAAPLGADFHIGLPPSVPQQRIARIQGFAAWRMLFAMDTLPPLMVLGMFWPWCLTFRTLNNPLLLQGPAALDTPAWWPIENGGAGGIGSATGLATVYHEFATGGRKLGLAPEVLQALSDAPPAPRNGWRDQVLKTSLVYSLGLEKPSPWLQFGSTPAAFGTFAVGGSFAFGDPATGLGYAYVTRKLGLYKWDDPREKPVREAVMACVARQPQACTTPEMETVA